MNLPTKLTVSRIVMTILIIIIMLFPFYAININFPQFYISDTLVDSRYLIAGGLFIIASLTDWLDGYIARKYGLITNTGKMLDAIADKILVNSVLIILASTNFIPAIIPVVIVLRDIVVNAIKMEAASRGKVVAAIGSLCMGISSPVSPSQMPWPSPPKSPVSGMMKVTVPIPAPLSRTHRPVL